MKRQGPDDKARRHARRLFERCLRDRRRWNRYVRERNFRRYSIPPAYGVHVSAPKRLCLLTNTVETIRHFREVETVLRGGRRAVHNLDATTEMDVGSTMVFFAETDHWGEDKVVTTVPRSIDLLRFAARSGLFGDTGWRTWDGRPPRRVRKDWAKSHGVTQRNSAIAQDMEAAAQLVDWATARLSRATRDGLPQLKALYRTMAEAMNNTVEHAGEKEAEERWWLAATFDGRASVVFGFLDMGRGLLETVPKKWLFSGELPPPSELLREIMEGRLGIRQALSETKKRNRGKGMMKMGRDAARGHLGDLFVLANGAYGWVGRGEYYTLPDDVSFSGTFLCWRISVEEDPHA